MHGPYMSLSPLDYNALDFLLLLWPDSLVDLISLETNRYAAGRGVKNWVPVSRDDIWAFLGIVVCMGIHRLPRIPNYWSSESLLGVPQVQKSMSLKVVGKLIIIVTILFLNNRFYYLKLSRPVELKYYY